MKKNLILTFLILVLGSWGAFAQQQPIELCDGAAQPDSGHVKVLVDKRVNDLIAGDVLMAGSEPTMSGYRVQVYSGKNRDEAERLKSFLETAYPNHTVYLIYESPYFKVRIGDFRNRLESMYLFHEMGLRYSSTLMVQDKINFPKAE